MQTKELKNEQGNKFAECSGTPLTPLRITTEEALKNMMHIRDLGRILEEAGFDLKAGQFFCLEPEEIMAKKPRDQLWCAFIYADEKGIYLEIRRPDLKLFRVLMIWNENGYWQPIIEDEPKAQKLDVGSLVMYTRNGVMIKVWRHDSKKIGHWTPKGGSLARGEPVPDDAQFVGFFQSNFQRITGPTIFGAPIAVYEVKVKKELKVDNSKFPAVEYTDQDRPEGYEELTSIHDMLKSDDGRALATMAKIISSASFDLYGMINNMAGMANVPFHCIADMIQLNDNQRNELNLAKQLIENK